MRGYPAIGETYGKYVVLRRIGRGGMGAVFEAKEQGTGRLVALKILSPDLSDEESFRRRFSQEAAMLLALDSPHVITIYDYGDIDGSLFIAMQLVPGLDLAAHLGDDRTLELEPALDIVAQVADALSDAHATGLIHRDVKPSNVLVRYIRGEPFAYLCDFGIARSEQSEHTRTQGVIGTFAYMAPELHQGAAADRRSDVYSLGCVLFAALSGRAPYLGTSEVQVAMAHIQQPVPVVDPALPCSAELQRIVSTAMAKDPADRYQTADKLRRAVRSVQQDVRLDRREPVRTVAAPTVDQTVLRTGAQPVKRDAPRKKRQMVKPGALVAAVAILLVLGLAGVGVALVTRNDDATLSPTARDVGTTAPTTLSPRPQPTRTASSADRSTRAASQTRAPSVTGPSAAPTRRAASAPAVTCWNSATAVDAAGCTTPAGASGLATVFPSFEGCHQVANEVQGKLEVYVCDRNSRYTIRYSSWATDADRYGYLKEANTGAALRPWVIDGEDSGTTWASYETPGQDPDEDMRHQWSATYTESPFSVSVEGITPTDRDAGIQHVRARPASQVGLR